MTDGTAGIVKHRLGAFWHRNAGLLSAASSAFIVLEGFALLFQPAKWWIPVLAFLAMSAIALSWRNHRVIIKAAITVIILAATASLSMVSAVAYSGSAEKAVIVPMAFLLGLCGFLLITYITLDTGASRWTAAQIALIVAFVFTYMAVPAGLNAMMSTAIVSIVLIGCAWMRFAPMWVNRKTNMPGRPTMIERRFTGKLTKALGDKWDVVTRDDLKYPIHVAVREGDDRLFVFIPMDFSTKLYEHRRKGLTYRNRSVEHYLYAVLAQVRSQTSDDAVMILEDLAGMSGYFGRVIALPVPDSEISHEYTSIIDLSGSTTEIRDDIDRIMDTFDYKGVSKRTRQRAMGNGDGDHGKEGSTDNA